MVTFPTPNPKVGDSVALRNISNAVRQALIGNITFQSYLRILPLNVTGDTTLSGNCVVLCDASGGDITLTLPPASTSNGIVYFVKKTESGAHTVTIDGDGSEEIDGATTHTLSGGSLGSVTLVCDGMAWWTL